MKKTVKLLLIGTIPVLFLSGCCGRAGCQNSANTNRAVIQPVQPIQLVQPVQRVNCSNRYQNCALENCYANYGCACHYVPCRGYSANGECVVW